RRNETGLALLSALLAVALLTVIVVEFADTSLLHAHLTRNAGNAIAAQMLARSAVTAVEDIYSSSDLKDDPIPPHSPITLPVEGGVIRVEKIDEEGKLDLNQINDKKQRDALEKLFNELGLDGSLLDKVAAWTTSPTSGKSNNGQSARDVCAL